VVRPSHPILSNLGAAIRRLRRERGLSQEALADLAQIDRSYMSSIERGRRNLSVLNVARIASALAIPPGDLLHVTEPPVDQFRRVVVAVDELSATLRLHQTPPAIAASAAAAPRLPQPSPDTWTPGWYLSLS
jgi:transcriptional regulator with XRE-family HTH domain